MSKVVLITGVLGGIGSETAGLFLKQGWQVIGVDRKPTGKQIPGITYICDDLSLPESPPRILSQVAAAGRLDALVNNAALQICKPMLATTCMEWDAIMAVNLRAVFLLSQSAFPLLKQCGGAIVNVGSVHAIATSMNIAAYASSKGGLLALTRAMALEFAKDSIRVNAILPGAVDTEMLHAGMDRGHANGSTLEERLKELGRKHPLGRIGLPIEIAKAILFLADNEQSSNVTGQKLIVDGGVTAMLGSE